MLLMGVDPGPTIDENAPIHCGSKTTIENFHSDQTFDVITLRMVAKDVTDLEPVVTSLARLTRPEGKVVIDTINRWSTVPIVTSINPFDFHHAIKRFLWSTVNKDTFPVISC
jgi:ubiquinone/menaquinone biosynthesis C-methylase UbiE